MPVGGLAIRDAIRLRLSVARLNRRRDTVLAATYEHDGARTYRLRLFKAVTGLISGPQRFVYLTGHQSRLTEDKI